MNLEKIPLDLIFILIPGIISTYIVQKMIVSDPWTNFKFSVNTLFFSGINYIIAASLLNLLHISNSISIDITYSKTQVYVNNFEVIVACIVGVFTAGITVLGSSRRWIYKAFQKLKLTNKFGDNNLYFEFLRPDHIQYIYLKDIERNLTYHGRVASFSESASIREIVLQDVDVYSYDKSEFAYNVEYLYLSYNIKESFRIEVPNFNTTELSQNG